MKKVSLYFKEGSSDKEYHIQLEQADGGFTVNFQYGRVGNALQAGTKTATPVSEAEAEKIYNKLLKEKTSKGYSEGEKKNDYSGVSVNVTKEVIILPQLLNPIEDVEAYINDNNYIAQEKFDGERRMIVYNSRTVIGTNKKGTEVPLPKSISLAIDQSNTHDCIIDGEMVGDKLFVFDVLGINGRELKDKSCFERLAYIHALNFANKHIEFVYTASSKKDKRELYEKLKAENKEGIVFKRIDAPYTHGRPASGGNQLKFKFYKTATFIVEGTTKGKRSIGLQLIDGNEKVFMGKCTIPPNFDVPNEGDLVEVRYLYANKGGAVYQPTYLGKRNDSDLTDATMAQIVYKETVE